MFAPGGEELKVPRTFSLYTKPPLKWSPSNLHAQVQTSMLPYPPSGDLDCKVTKSAKSPCQDVRGERKKKERVTGQSRPQESSSQVSAIPSGTWKAVCVGWGG